MLESDPVVTAKVLFTDQPVVAMDALPAPRIRFDLDSQRPQPLPAKNDELVAQRDDLKFQFRAAARPARFRILLTMMRLPTGSIRLVALFAIVIIAASSNALPARADDASIAADALARLNYYRTMAKLPVVALDQALSAEAAAHAHYLVVNGIADGRQPNIGGYYFRSRYE